MAHKTLIGGTAYEVSGGKTLVNGTAYEIKSGKTLVGGTAYDVGFAKPLGELAIGSSVFLNVGGQSTEFVVVHHGLPSNLYDSSCDGTWLFAKTIDSTNKSVWNSSGVNTYANSDVHSYLNSTYFEKLDAGVRELIKTVKIPYCIGNGNATVCSGANGLSTKVFLLGGYEIGWNTSSRNIPIDGAKLDYFIYGYTNEADERRKADYYLGWDLRSINTANAYDVVGVTKDGGSSSHKVTSSYCVRPAFILPSEIIL